VLVSWCNRLEVLRSLSSRCPLRPYRFSSLRFFLDGKAANFFLSSGPMFQLLQDVFLLSRPGFPFPLPVVLFVCFVFLVFLFVFLFFFMRHSDMKGFP